ncbi:MAG: hypothetical protein JXQ93_04595 [Flavobacteriaceae bacterium]
MLYLSGLEINNSKKNEKLQFSNYSFWGKFFEYTLIIIMSLVLPLITFLNLVHKINNGGSLLWPTTYLIITLSVFFLIIYSRIKSLQLKRVKGNSRSKNRTHINAIAEEMNWEILRHDQQITILSKKWTWTSTNWGRSIFILYDKKDILICCITYGKHQMISPFHWFSNKKIEKKLVKKLQASFNFNP